MEFTNEQIEAIKAAALPLDYGSITIQFGATLHYMDIEVHHKVRVDKEPKKGQSLKSQK